jgi:hypothetical protein
MAGTEGPDGDHRNPADAPAAIPGGAPRLHAFRHTYAHRWLSSGGSEGHLLQLAGWPSRQMLSRYGPRQRPSGQSKPTGGYPQGTDSNPLSLFPRTDMTRM